jgi:hypothetical protein
MEHRTENHLLAPAPQAMRRFPAPWIVEAIDAGFKIVDGNKQTIAHVYGHADPRDAAIAGSLTLDEARRIAGGIAKLSTLLAKG